MKISEKENKSFSCHTILACHPCYIRSTFYGTTAYLQLMVLQSVHHVALYIS